MILIAAVGQRQPAWVNDAVADYLERFPADQRPTIKEIRAEPRTTGKTVEIMLAAEADRIAASLPRDCVMIALDERGKSYTTVEFSQFLRREQERSGNLAFLIGGPDGLDPALKSRCSHQIRLSAMTLPHGMVRVMLAEQLYRAWSIQKNHPYHRA